MARSPYPHEDLVQELRELLCNMPSTHNISDDMDQYYVGAAGHSPMERTMSDNSRRFRRAEAISQELVKIGPPAAEAVALGLRMRGRWREYLVPYVEAHGSTAVISDALQLVRKRKNDPLSDAIE